MSKRQIVITLSLAVGFTIAMGLLASRSGFRDLYFAFALVGLAVVIRFATMYVRQNRDR